MSKRIDVSNLQNNYYDAQRLDQLDLEVEQNKNNQTSAAIINNHFGSGVLLSSLDKFILFDSDNMLPANIGLPNFDGTGIVPSAQPSDLSLGNQLEVELTGSIVVGRLGMKVAIIGLSFDGTIQMDRLFFYKNEKQVTSNRYVKILSLFFNDFKGNGNCSRNNGGRVVIREASSFQMSRDAIMIAQDTQPDVFWRDFKVPVAGTTLESHLQSGVGSQYSIDGLNIATTGNPDRELLANDVVFQVGQKFIANTNNIQKITLLMGASEITGADIADKYKWEGDIVISVYSLQNTIDCPSDIVPGLAIDFEPDSKPLVQLSYNITTLKEAGYVLTDMLQPVDFVFSNTKLGAANTSGITVGKFYAVTVKRSGAANSGTILLGTGTNRVENSRLTLFNGVWADVPNEDLWFQVWTDAIKVSDGQAYDAGNGITASKVITDPITGATINNVNGGYSLVDFGKGNTNTVVMKAVVQESVKQQDERTGNTVFSRKQFVPEFSFETNASLAKLKKITDPLIIGAVTDNNPKHSYQLNGTQSIFGLVKQNIFKIVNPSSDFITNNLIGSRLFPNLGSTTAYTIVRASYCTDGYGDVDGDGVIDLSDLERATELLGEDLSSSVTQQKILDGYIDPLEILRANVSGGGVVVPDDITQISNYINKLAYSFPHGSSFHHLTIEVQADTGRYDTIFDCGIGFVKVDGHDTNIVQTAYVPAEDLVYYGYNGDIMMDLDSVFSITPFTPVDFKISPRPYWNANLLGLSSDVRLVAAAFTSSDSIVHPACSSYTTFECTDLSGSNPNSDSGRNDIFVPDNLHIGNGELLRPNGDFYKVDLEIGTVILNLPEIPLNNFMLDVMRTFVADNDNSGFTIKGYPAMRFADCSTVKMADLSLGRVRFGVSIQSIVSNLDGYNVDDGYGIIVDDLFSLNMNHSTGVMTINVKDLLIDDINNLITKIQIQVFLKKAGWNNQVLSIRSEELLGLGT